MMVYTFDDSPGVVTALGIVENTNNVAGAPPQPSANIFFGGVSDLIEKIGDTYNKIRKPNAPSPNIPVQANGGGGVQVIQAPADMTKTVVVAGLVIVSILVLIAIFK